MFIIDDGIKIFIVVVFKFSMQLVILLSAFHYKIINDLCIVSLLIEFLEFFLWNILYTLICFLFHNLLKIIFKILFQLPFSSCLCRFITISIIIDYCVQIFWTYVIIKTIIPKSFCAITYAFIEIITIYPLCSSSNDILWISMS